MAPLLLALGWTMRKGYDMGYFLFFSFSMIMIMIYDYDWRLFFLIINLFRNLDMDDTPSPFSFS
jgi:hypothetical protein